mgnify:CR=1 FL=1
MEAENSWPTCPEQPDKKGLPATAVSEENCQTLFHGSRADLRPGDEISAGYQSNYGARRKSEWVYLTGTLDAAIWGAELAKSDGRERIYIVERTGPIFDDPNLTDNKFPGNPTQSYRSRESSGSSKRWPNGRGTRLSVSPK